MGSRPTALAVGLLAAVTIGGCTTTEAGTPQTDQPGDASTSSTGSITTAQPGEPTVAIPPRPKPLPLDGVEPCSLFDKSALDQLKITEEPKSSTSTDTYKAKQCVLDVTTDDVDYSYAALLITTEGMAAWLDGKRNVDAKLVSIGGYGAAEFYLSSNGQGSGNSGCSVSVDVADGQQLMVDLTPFDKGSLTRDDECHMTEQAATFAVSMLQSKG